MTLKRGAIQRSTTLAMHAALVAVMHQVSEPRTIQREAALPNNWSEDVGKKKTTVKPCSKCAIPFFGRIKRKYCYKCQQIVTRHLKENETERKPFEPFNSKII